MNGFSIENSTVPRWPSTATVILGLLIGLYYGSVVLGSLHGGVAKLLVVWGAVLICLPGQLRSLTREELWLVFSTLVMALVALLSYAVNDLWNHPAANGTRYVRFLVFLPIYMVMRRFITPPGFWFGLLIGAMATGVWGVLEFSGLVRGPGDRWGAVSGAVNPIQFGDLSLIMAAMICAGLPLYRQYGRASFVLAVLAVALSLFCCIASEVRGAWVAVPALTVLLAWTWIRTRFVSIRVLALSAAAIVVLAAVFLPRTNFYSRAQSAVEQVRDYSEGKIGNSAGVRFEMWRASWEVFKQHPLVGVGPGLYQTKIQALAAEKGGYDSSILGYSHPHSDYVFVMVTLGGLGLLALAALYLLPLIYFMRRLLSDVDPVRWPALAGVVLIIGYAHFGLTEALFFQHLTFLGFYLMSVAALYGLVEQYRTGSGLRDS